MTTNSTQTSLKKLKKEQLLELVEKYKQTAKESVLNEAVTKKELLITKEQLEATNIAINDSRKEIARLTTKINTLEDSEANTHRLVTLKNDEISFYIADRENIINKYRMSLFWLGVTGLISIVSIVLFIYSINLQTLINLTNL